MKKKPVNVHDPLLGDVVIINSMEDLKKMFLEAIADHETREKSKKKKPAIKAKPKKKKKA